MRNRSFLSKKSWLHPTKKKQVAKIILFSLLILVPAGWLFNQDAIQSKILSNLRQENGPADSSEISLKKIIAQQYPIIENPDISDWRKVEILRRWAYGNIKVSTTNCLLEKVYYSDFNNKSVTEVYLALKNNVGGVWCGGTSVFLAKLYRYYGFEAYTVNMGINGLWSHVVTLVAINHEGKKLLSIQDAYTDVTYTHQNGSPLDFFDLIHFLHQRQSQKIKTIQAFNIGRYLLICPGADKKEIDALKGKEVLPCESLPTGRELCRKRHTLEYFTNLAPTATKVKQRLKQDGYEPDFLYIFLYTFSIHDGVRESKDLLNRFKAMAKAPDFK